MKTEPEKLDINKLVNVPTSLSNLETKVDGLDVGKLKTIIKVSNVVDQQLVENLNLNTVKTKVNNLDKKIPDATTLI